MRRNHVAMSFPFLFLHKQSSDRGNAWNYNDTFLLGSFQGCLQGYPSLRLASLKREISGKISGSHRGTLLIGFLLRLSQGKRCAQTWHFTLGFLKKSPFGHKETLANEQMRICHLEGSPRGAALVCQAFLGFLSLLGCLGFLGLFFRCFRFVYVFVGFLGLCFRCVVLSFLRFC